METKTLGKGLIIAVLGLGAFGLLAGERPATNDVDFTDRAATLREAQEVKEVTQVQEVADAPRECDLQRGIETSCTFL